MVVTLIETCLLVLSYTVLICSHLSLLFRSNIAYWRKLLLLSSWMSGAIHLKRVQLVLVIYHCCPTFKLRLYWKGIIGLRQVGVRCFHLTLLGKSATGLSASCRVETPDSTSNWTPSLTAIVITSTTMLI
jgi:hypothetical protein